MKRPISILIIIFLICSLLTGCASTGKRINVLENKVFNLQSVIEKHKEVINHNADSTNRFIKIQNVYNEVNRLVVFYIMDNLFMRSQSEETAKELMRDLSNATDMVKIFTEAFYDKFSVSERGFIEITK